MPSVVEQTPYNEYTGNGVATVYPYEFELLSADDLVVTIDGVVIPASDFTLAGVGVQAGGTVTFDTAPANGTAVLLSREIALQRDIDYQTNGDLASATLDLDVNRLWQALQGFWARITGAIRAPYPEQLEELPSAADRALKTLAFDADGQPTVLVPVSGSAADVLTQLADPSSASNGAGLVGFLYSLGYASGTIGRWLKDLALAAGSTFIGWAAAGTGAVTRTASSKLRGEIHVEDFGAVGDGTTDDSAAFALAFATAVIGTTPSKVKTTPGKTYSVSELVINGPTNNNNSRGEYGLTFDFTGSVLKGRAAATWILRVGQATGIATWANGVKLLCGTLNMADMTDVSTNYGLDFRNAYNLKIIDPVVMGEGSNKIGISFRDRAYTARVENPSCTRFKSVGNILASDAVTTLTLVVPDIMQLILEDTSSVNVFGGAIQSASGSKVVLTNVYNINFFGVDVEGAAGTAYDLTGGGCSYVRVYAGNVTSGLTYVTGTGTACLFDDRDRGAYAVTYGKASQNISTTSATTIFSFLGDTLAGGNPAGMSLVLVSGDDGSNGFMDLVMCAYGFTYPAVTRTMYGSPPARTYTFSGANLRVALASVAANNVRVALLSNPT